MRRLLIAIGATLAALLLWTVGFGYAVLEGWGRTPIAPRGDTAAFVEATKRKVAADPPSKLAMAMLEDGRVVATEYVSAAEPVNGETLFQSASLAKWVTAFGVMTLVQDGRLDLDAPVSRYLTRWSLPPGPYGTDGVTARRLLSHTAGLTDGLGYAGFGQGETPQSLEQSLARAADASPGADGRVRVGLEPGTEFLYSGGGYALLQLLVEEVSKRPFAEYMRERVFRPLGMHRTTYAPAPQTPNRAGSFTPAGERVETRRFTAVAATSLFTTTNDMSRFLQAQLPGPNGEPPGRGVLGPDALELMRAPQASKYGAPIWGLGVVLYAPTDDGENVIGHDGVDEPALNTTARLNPASGNGIVVLTTGGPRLATQIGGDWTLWETGRPDLFTLTAELRSLIAILAAGWGVILVAAAALILLDRRRRARRAEQLRMIR